MVVCICVGFLCGCLSIFGFCNVVVCVYVCACIFVFCNVLFYVYVSACVCVFIIVWVL